MRIALFHYEDVVVFGIAAILDRDAPDIDLVHFRTRHKHPIDLVLVDPAYSSDDEPAQVSRLLADPGVRRVAVLTRTFQPWTASEFFARGYGGYLGFALPHEDLPQAFRDIHHGERVLAPGDHSRHGDWPGQAHGLTERESDVLSLIASGLSNREIATRLNVSINSVKSYIRNAYGTLGVDSRTKALLWALTHGFHASAADSSDDVPRR